MQSISPRRLLVLGVSASAFVLSLLEAETTRAIRAGDSIQAGYSLVNHVYAWRRLRVRSLSLSDWRLRVRVRSLSLSAWRLRVRVCSLSLRGTRHPHAINKSASVVLSYVVSVFVLYLLVIGVSASSSRSFSIS